MFKNEQELEKHFIDEASTFMTYNKNIKDMESLLENFFKRTEERYKIKLTEKDKQALSRDMDLEAHHLNTGRIKKAFDLMYVEEGFEFKLESGKTIFFEFIDRKNIWNNTFEIVNQLTIVNPATRAKARYDVVIIINGIPRIAHELKSEQSALVNAISQLKRYHAQNFYGLLNYITILVAANNNKLRYCVNNEKFKENTFWKWENEEGHTVRTIDEYVKTFIDPPIMVDILQNDVFVKFGKILQLKATGKKIENLKADFHGEEIYNVILKGYQHRCKKNVIDRTFRGLNSLCWLHMGSGKTLLALTILQENKRNGYQVIMIVDRCELNSQSRKEFIAYDMNSITITEKADELKNAIRQGKSLVTTIQALNAILFDTEFLNQIKKMDTSKIVFIQDEAHRTQGNMVRATKQAFPKAVWIGLTGTPILKHEQLNSPDKKTSLEQFGLSEYTFVYQMSKAMRDKQTSKILIEQRKLKTKYKAPPEKEVEDNRDKFDGEDCSEIISRPLKEKNRIKEVAEDIITSLSTKCIWNHVTNRLIFQAMVMVCDVDATNLFLHALDEAQKKHGTNYKFAAIGTLNRNKEYTDPQNYENRIYSNVVLNHWLDRYNKMLGLKPSEYYTEYDKYEADVLDKFKKQEIDFVIVNSKLTTGFDNPNINTLYMDRYFSIHGLLQAIARATRMTANKLYANIVSYLPIKDDFNKALILYNNDEDVSEFINWAPYSTAVSIFKEKVEALKKISPNPEYARDNFETAEKQKPLIKAFFEVYNQYKILKAYIEYFYDEIDFGIPESHINHYRGLINDWREESSSKKTTEFEELDFFIIDDDIIEVNVEYIKKLISSIVYLKTKTEKEKRAKEIIKQIESSKNQLIIAQKKILIKSVEEAINSDDIEDYNEKIRTVIEQMRENDIKDFTDRFKIDNDVVSKLFNKYDPETEDSSMPDISNVAIEQAKKHPIKGISNFNRQDELRRKLDEFIKNLILVYNTSY